MPWVRGKRAGRHRGVPHAGHRRQVGVGGAAEPRAAIHQPAQPPGPLVTVPGDVVRAHLIDDKHDDQRRRRGRGGLGRGSGEYQGNSDGEAAISGEHGSRRLLVRRGPSGLLHAAPGFL